MSGPTKISPLEDFRIKTEKLHTLYDIVAKAESGFRSDAFKRAPNVIDVDVDKWIDDDFRKAWVNLFPPGVTLKALNDFRDKYALYKSWAIQEVAAFQSKPKLGDFREQENKLEASRRRLERVATKRPTEYVDKVIANEFPGRTGRSMLVSELVAKELQDMRAAAQKVLDRDSDEYREIEDTVGRVINEISDPTQTDYVSTIIKDLPRDLLKVVVTAAETAKSENDPFNPRQTSEDDFLRFLETSEYVKSNPKLQLDPDTREVVVDKFRMSKVTNELLVALVRVGSALQKEVERKIQGVRDEQTKRDLTALRDALTSLSTGAIIAAGTNKRPPQLDEVMRAIRRSDLLGEKSAAALFGKGGFSSASGLSDDRPGLSFLYRKVDRALLDRYVKQLEAFDARVSTYTTKENVGRSLKRLREHLGALGSQANTMRQQQSQGLSNNQQVSTGGSERFADAKVASMEAFIKSVKREVSALSRAHARFLSQRHRDGHDYIAYWTRMKNAISDPEALASLGKYADIRKRIMESADTTIAAVVRDVGEAYSEARGQLGDSANSVQLSDMQISAVEDHFESLTSWLDKQSDDIQKMHIKGGPSLISSFNDPHVIMIYALKVLRIAFAWVALRVASNVFQTVYENRVYANDKDPPLPLLFIAIFTAVDLALNVAVGIILLVLKSMFKNTGNDFPVDDVLIGAWAFDVVCGSVLMVALSFAIGEIVRKKKYFRYKYEGDRGIRAMRQMVFYTYCIVLFIPFFRLVHG